MLKAQILMWRIVEWGRNVQIQFLAVHCFHLCASSISHYAAAYLPFSSQLCELSLAMLLSNTYKIITGGIVGSSDHFPSLCCRDPRNSGCLPPDSASNPTLWANQLLSYHKPRGKVCSTLAATRNCCSECKGFIVDLLWVAVSVFHVYDRIEYNRILTLSSLESQVWSSVVSLQRACWCSLGTHWYKPILGRYISLIAQVTFISLPVCWHCTYCYIVQECCVGC